MAKTVIRFPSSSSFSIDWNWRRQYYIAREQPSVPHIHDAYEAYIHVKGAVSFMANGCVYPVTAGDVILTRPLEPHFCIYQTDVEQEYFCIWIPQIEDCGLLSPFYGVVEKNYISLPEAERMELLSLCYGMERIKEEAGTQLERYSLLLQLLVLLGGSGEKTFTANDVPSPLRGILYYIDRNFTTIRRIREIAEHFYISQNTLDRLFREHLHLSPKQYIEAKRLSYAKRLLHDKEKSVLDCSLECGFSDPSHFIARFKSFFGQTPLQYKNALYR